jgi:hypothetical protein
MSFTNFWRRRRGRAGSGCVPRCSFFVSFICSAFYSSRVECVEHAPRLPIRFGVYLAAIGIARARTKVAHIFGLRMGGGVDSWRLLICPTQGSIALLGYDATRSPIPSRNGCGNHLIEKLARRSCEAPPGLSRDTVPVFVALRDVRAALHTSRMYLIAAFTGSSHFFNLSSSLGLFLSQFPRVFRAVTGRASFLFHFTLRSLTREAFLLFEALRSYSPFDIALTRNRFQECPNQPHQVRDNTSFTLGHMGSEQ